MERKRVVITGMGLVSCFGKDINHFYNQLLEGISGVRHFDLFKPEENFPTNFGGIVQDFNPEDFLDKKQARRVDRCMAYAVGAGKMALQHANIDLATLDKERAGILVGSGMGGMNVYTEGAEAMTLKGFNRVSPFFVPYILTNSPGALLAIETGFVGPNYSISTACATSNYSIYSAAEHIRRGDVDIMIAGGAEASINRLCYAGFSSMKSLSRRNDAPEKASCPWDKGRDGFVVGEGCAVFVLESLEHAQKRGVPILGEYLGGALTCDAYHITEPIPDGKEVARCITLALKDANVSPQDVDYINAHATSTPVGDLCEIRAIKRVFQEKAQPKINATKSLIGHALGASGALGLIATMKALETGWVHPTLNLNDPEEEIADLDVVRGHKQKCNPRIAISNSFGFGGHNSVIVVKRYEE